MPFFRNKNMRILQVCLIFLILSHEIFCATQEQLDHVNSNGDSGLWLEETLQFPLHPCCNSENEDNSSEWLLTLHGEQRWASRFQVQWYSEYQELIQYDLADSLKEWFSLDEAEWFKKFYFGPGLIEYSQLEKQNFGPGLTKWVWAIRPIVQADIFLTYRGWDFKQRIRFERQMFLNPFYHDYSDLRVRFDFFAPWKGTCFQIQPFISNEFFFRKKTYNAVSNPTGILGGLYDDLVRVGFISQLSDMFELEIYYQLRLIKQKISATNSLHYWSNNNLGIKVTAEF